MMDMAGSPLGIGNTADVYDTGCGRVVKLFHEGYSKGSVLVEFENSKLLNQLDLPIARSHELVCIQGRDGIVYDRIAGVSLLDILMQTQDIEKYSVKLAQTHRRALTRKLPGARYFKSILRSNICYTDKLTADVKAKLYAMLETLPEGDCFCHGDFHFGNVLMAGGEFYIIDYMNVCQGHAYLDVARTVYLTQMTPVPADVGDKDAFMSLKRRATDIYLGEMGIGRGELDECLTVTAAARLSELRSDQAEECGAVLEFLSNRGFI